ncbi:CgeB family protein [Caldisalinibacter kiritimatiensis]|uniref:Spore protein YkvP/CgeB glycosyl transferase-like domain-containing protein n=1 Tax=Caldisalinibacter kiritimatiensis TaxID=1304284 RepID=R1ATL8_9FIRM|nr:glycosyltransferase [Caldisalinibacter kiritimatiensis]EOC99971.1 hypothetical protein L21TH_2016 [Caldisalinibacter kiritimatiensis]
MNNLKIVSILDKFSHECFKYECNLIHLKCYDWEDTINKTNSDILFVESAWEGIYGNWRGKVFDLHKNKDSTLKQIVSFCKKRNIPTVFWNKEDPENFYRFIEAAKLFDYVFTTDVNCIPLYKEILSHNRIYVLPFACQPRIHNPIGRNNEILGSVAFAGSWYNRGHGNRNENMEIILKPAFKYDLHIYDRFHNSNNNFFRFPDEYQPYIKGRKSYNEIIELYKKYPIFLNVNSVDNSPTMFSRRIFELLACGTCVISSYSIGIENTFKDIVLLSNSFEETDRYLYKLLNDERFREKLSIKGQNEVFSKHTYKHRLKFIIEKLKNI